MLLALGLSILIGLLLGLLGGGGSILTVPMLVYVLGLEPKVAILTSFAVVGTSSITALIPHGLRRSVCWKSGVLFGMIGMLGAFAGGRLAVHVSGQVLMVMFAIVSFITGALMMRPPRQTAVSLQRACPLRIPYLKVIFDGFLVGGLTGMVGVGGGFLIVPALTMGVGLPIQSAIGTSLLVIAMNALAGLLGYSQHASLDVHLTLLAITGTVAGSALGAMLSVYVKPKWLRSAFAVMVILIAIYILTQSLTLALFKQLQLWLFYPDSVYWLATGALILGVILQIGRWIHKSSVMLPNERNQVVLPK